MHMATLLSTDLFPVCKKCARRVRFTLVRAVRKAVLPFRPNTILESFPQDPPELEDTFSMLK